MPTRSGTVRQAGGGVGVGAGVGVGVGAGVGAGVGGGVGAEVARGVGVGSGGWGVAVKSGRAVGAAEVGRGVGAAPPAGCEVSSVAVAGGSVDEAEVGSASAVGLPAPRPPPAVVDPPGGLVSPATPPTLPAPNAFPRIRANTATTSTATPMPTGTRFVVKSIAAGVPSTTGVFAAAGLGWASSRASLSATSALAASAPAASASVEGVLATSASSASGATKGASPYQAPHPGHASAASDQHQRQA